MGAEVAAEANMTGVIVQPEGLCGSKVGIERLH